MPSLIAQPYDVYCAYMAEGKLASVAQFLFWADTKGLPRNRSAAELFIRTELATTTNPDHAYNVRTYATTR